ncbi:MAG: hypothetical protein WCO58_03370 [bacterium]
MSFKQIEKRVHTDYEDNFLPRTEFKLSLNPEEIFTLLEDKKFQRDIAVTWHFKFYIKQILIASVEKIEEPVRKQFLEELRNKSKEIFSLFGNNQSRSLLAMLQLKFCIETIDDYDLQDLFRGHSHYDEWCAQVAYEEYLRRKKS